MGCLFWVSLCLALGVGIRERLTDGNKSINNCSPWGASQLEMSEPTNWFVWAVVVHRSRYYKVKKALAAEHISREDYY